VNDVTSDVDVLVESKEVCAFSNSPNSKSSFSVAIFIVKVEELVVESEDCSRGRD
jgi:hypothetical protein